VAVISPAHSPHTVDRFAPNPHRFRHALQYVGMLGLLGSLLASIYVPTVPVQFDFVDDGALVYSSGENSFWGFQREVWSKTYAEFQDKGPFRPGAWYFWVGQQRIFGADVFGWRVFRFVWTALAAATFLWLLRELGFGWGVSLLTTAAAMWNPYRAEVWLSLTHCEGIALPFAMAGLVAAYRAPRSAHSWRWDAAAMTCALVAVGCKNVFAVVIPAQMFLRVCHPDLSLREGFKQYRWRAALLATVLIFPVTHFVCYRLTMHANRHELAWDPRQPLRMLNALLGGAGKDFLGPAIIAGLALAVWHWRRAGNRPSPPDANALSPENARLRAAGGAGVILFVLGWGVYAPLQGVAGRYTFPGVWGLDLLCALLWAKVFTLPTLEKKLTLGLLACGLLISVGANYGKQEKNSARIATLWDALECVERDAPIGSRIAWIGLKDRLKSDELEISEGIHFGWHLKERGRPDLHWQFIAAQMPHASAAEQPDIAITSAEPPYLGAWRLLRACSHEYWFGRHKVNCCVWQHMGVFAPPALSSEPAGKQGL
jgi:hypothetical protein